MWVRLPPVAPKHFRGVKLTANLPVSKTGYQSSSLCIPALEPVAQLDESATLRRSRSHVRFVPGSPIFFRDRLTLAGRLTLDQVMRVRLLLPEPTIIFPDVAQLARGNCLRNSFVRVRISPSGLAFHKACACNPIGRGGRLKICTVMSSNLSTRTTNFSPGMNAKWCAG